jgi:hypothetical protein
MNKSTSWAIASAVIVVLGVGCTVESTSDTGDGGTTSTTGSSGSGGSGSGGTTGTSTGGTGGSTSEDGGPVCMAGGTTACHTCAFDSCNAEHCACMADADGCGGSTQTAYYTCISAPNADEAGCGTTFATNAGGVGNSQDLANDLATCMTNNCLDKCQGGDGGRL